MRVAAGLVVAFMLVSVPASAQASGPFDGSWTVTVSCPPDPGGARGYNLIFDAQVSNGTLRGLYGTEGRAPWLRLEGQVQPNGAAALFAHGQTGNPDVAIGHLNTGTPYSYRVSAQFEGARGSGRRIDVRPCTLGFVRR
jgi:hypothetical protein